jgi:long-chain acyl-CoA synthetase
MAAGISHIVTAPKDTLRESGLQHSLNEPESVGIFNTADVLPVVAKVIIEPPSLREVIYDGHPPRVAPLQYHKLMRGHDRTPIRENLL